MSCLSSLRNKGTVICVETALHQGGIGDQNHSWTLTLKLEIDIEPEIVAYHVDVTPTLLQRRLQQPGLLAKAVEDLKKSCKQAKYFDNTRTVEHILNSPAALFLHSQYLSSSYKTR
jgi:hypothetical protein